MPFLPSSGAISIADLNSFFPGSGTAMSNFYRGGGRVPTTKTVTTTTREPASGWFYSRQAGNLYFYASVELFWQPLYYEVPFNSSSFTVGNVTYLRGPIVESSEYAAFYQIARTITSTSTVNINTGIPSSGQISLSQFYGAETP